MWFEWINWFYFILCVYGIIKTPIMIDYWKIKTKLFSIQAFFFGLVYEKSKQLYFKNKMKTKIDFRKQFIQLKYPPQAIWHISYIYSNEYLIVVYVFISLSAFVNKIFMLIVGLFEFIQWAFNFNSFNALQTHTCYHIISISIVNKYTDKWYINIKVILFNFFTLFSQFDSLLLLCFTTQI